MCWAPSPPCEPRGLSRDRAEALAAGWWSSAALAGDTETSLFAFPRSCQSGTGWLEFTDGETEVITGDLRCPSIRVYCSPMVLSLPRLTVLNPCFQLPALFFDYSGFWVCLILFFWVFFFFFSIWESSRNQLDTLLARGSSGPLLLTTSVQEPRAVPLSLATLLRPWAPECPTEIGASCQAMRPGAVNRRIFDLS